MWKVYYGNVLEILQKLPDEFVQCVITSPPYYGLRAYETNPQIWDGDPDCKHEWGEELSERKRGSICGANAKVGNTLSGVSGTEIRQGCFCIKCGAWRGELGLEPTPEMYVNHLVQIFREVRRVLRKDGTVWLNLGDTFRGKNLIGIPWRVAFALQADGWWLRSDIIWEKGNCMPESVRDRPTRCHEYVFLLTKSQRYFYDAEAIKEPLAESSKERMKYPRYAEGSKGTTGKYAVTNKDYNKKSANRNKRTVWHINTKPYKGAHFACFPPELPRICILAGTSLKTCPKCGAPWERIVKTVTKEIPRFNSKSLGRRDCQYGESPTTTLRAKIREVTTIDWQPTCSCEGNDGSGKCIVLDPFAGSGTTLQVAEEHGRDSIGIELNPDYCKLIEERMANLPKIRQVSLF